MQPATQEQKRKQEMTGCIHVCDGKRDRWRVPKLRVMRLYINVSNLYISVKSPPSRIYPTTEGRPPSLPPCLSVQPLPRECKCCGVVDHERGLVHAHVVPRFWGHPCFWINEEGMLEVRSTLLRSSCRQPTKECRLTDRSIELDYAERNSPLGRPKNSRAKRSTRKPLTNQLPTCYIHTQTHTPAVPQNGRYIPCSILVYCSEVEYTNHTMFHMYCKPILYSRYIVIDHSSLRPRKSLPFINTPLRA